MTASTFAGPAPEFNGNPPPGDHMPNGRSQFGKLMGPGVIASALVVSAFCNALNLWELHRLNNPGIPPIAGATDVEQKGEAVRAGFAKGLECKRLMAGSFAGSWAMMAQDVRDGMPWSEVWERWSRGDQSRRDDPLVRAMVRDFGRFYPVDDTPPTPAQQRSGFLYQSAFSAAWVASPRP